MSSSVILWKMTTVPGSRNVTETLVRCTLQRDFSSSTMYTSHYFSVVCNNIEWLTCQPTCPHPQLPDNVFNTQKIRIVLKHELDHASPSLNLSMASHCIARPFELAPQHLISFAITVPLAHSRLQQHSPPTNSSTPPSYLRPQDLSTCCSLVSNALPQTFLLLTLSHPSDLNFFDIPKVPFLVS